MYGVNTLLRIARFSLKMLEGKYSLFLIRNLFCMKVVLVEELGRSLWRSFLYIIYRKAMLDSLHTRLLKKLRKFSTAFLRPKKLLEAYVFKICHVCAQNDTYVMLAAF